MSSFLLTTLWYRGKSARYVWYNAGWGSFESKFREVASSGFVLSSLDVSEEGGSPAWTGAWTSGNARQELSQGLSLSVLLQRKVQLAARGLELVRLRSHRGPGGRSWAGAWRSGTESSTVVGPLPWDAFWSQWLTQHSAGHRMVDFDTYVESGRRFWAGVWQPGTGDQFLWVDSNWQSFSGKNEELRRAGLGLVSVRSYSDGQTRKWAGVWGHGSDSASLVADLTENEFWVEWDRQLSEGRRLARVHVWSGSGFAPPSAFRARVRIHLKILAEPAIPVTVMLDRMREVYEPAGIQVEVGSVEQLSRADLVDIDVGGCTQMAITHEQQQLFAARASAADRDIVIYLVRSTLPPYNGCAAHPPGRPGAVIASYATEWTLAHEVGHVLGLYHIADHRRLMTGLGTGNIVDPPPDLAPDELQQMLSSSLLASI